MKRVSISGASLQQAIPGFESIRRYYDSGNGIIAARILPGEYYVTRLDEMVCTVLGSCVSACIRDARTGVGGMNHFMLPIAELVTKGPSNQQIDPDHPFRYGNYAMEHLINDVLTYGSGDRGQLEIKVFGGGRVLGGGSDIGMQNIEFVRRFLATEGYTVSGSDLGGDAPRKLLYFPRTGKARVKKLKQSQISSVVRNERAYMETLVKAPVAGEVELF
ncbi:MAG: chemoreceptor glutamine deamidase CheD [Gammaproteobacteria bacterium]|nr:chemoreceptor glutamine deamidase CheD [Gammaproteobacteria bacterium]